MSENKLKFWRIPLYYHDKAALFAFAETEERAIELITEDLINEGYDVGEDGVEFGYPEHWDVEESVIDPYYDA